MSEQGKNVLVGKCEKCSGDLYMTHNGCCTTEYTCLGCGYYYEIDEYAVAETAATEYAQQAAELQEEVERLRGMVDKTICTLLWQTDLRCKCNLCTKYRQTSDRLERILAEMETQ